MQISNFVEEGLIHYKRTQCRLCGSMDLSCVVPMEPIPISEHYEVNACKDAKRYPIDIYQCNDCSAVQTLDEISADFLWKDYTYYSGMTTRIREHFREFADSLVKRAYPDQLGKVNGLAALDVGCNDGTLLESLRDKGFDVTGIDPADTVTSVCKGKGITTHVELFTRNNAEKIFRESKFSLVTAFNVFAHSSDLESFLEGVTYVLGDEGVFCFEVQYLADVCQKHILGTFFHEHMVHYSITALEAFLGRHGLEICTVDNNDIQMGSIIVYAAYSGSVMVRNLKDDEALKRLKKRERDLGIDNCSWSFGFRDKMLKNRRKAQEFIKEHREIAAYGAARSGPSLAIQNGISEKVSAIFDDHPAKVGKYSPFKGIRVQPSDELTPANQKITVLLAYLHYKPILRQNLEYMEEGGKFVLLWPEFAVVDQSNYREIVG